MESSFAIIAEPNRRAILSLLASSERSVGEIERQLRMPQTSVSKHLRVLREAGFVEARVEAQRRVYRLRPEPLMEVDAWLAPFRRFWTAHVDALERHLDRMEQTIQERKEAMSHREQYAPGPATGADVRKDGEKWTLVLVRELRHPPARVWQALTDPEHLSRMGAVRRRSEPGRRGAGEALDGRGADAAGLRDEREASRGAAGCSSTTGAATTSAGSSSRAAAARGSRSGTTSIAASSRGAPPAGTSASTCWTSSSRASRSAASSAPRRWSSAAGSD